MAFAALALGQLLVDIDDVVLNIALPTIAEEIGIPVGQLPWVVNAYVLCFGGLLLLGGRLADRHGPRTILLAGIATFTVASGFGALAQSAAQVVAARAGQGIAAALLAPAAMSLLVSIFPEPEERSRALGLWGAVTGAGAVLGLVLGGVVTEHLGWRWIFGGNAVVAVVIGASVVALLPRGSGRRDVRIEPWGTLLATAGLITAVYSLHGTLEHGWTDPRTLGLLALSALALGAAVLIWRRGSAPLVPARLLTDRTVLVSDACAALTGASLLGTFYFVSLHLQEVLGYSPTATAWAYLPLVAGLVVAAGLGSALVPRLGARPVLVAGMIGCALGLALLGLIGMSQTRGSFWTTLFPGLLVCGLGLGLAFVSLTVTAIPGGEQSEDGGVASGLYNTSIQIGGALGIAVLATVATRHADDLVAAGGDPLAAIAAGRTLALYVGSALLVAGAMIAVLLPPTAGRTGDTDAHVTGAA
jgi:EmrB/QacA subfamily drug resistance transporter